MKQSILGEIENFALGMDSCTDYFSSVNRKQSVTRIPQLISESLFITHYS